MKRFIEGKSRSQITLLPECLDDYIAEDNGYPDFMIDPDPKKTDVDRPSPC